MRKTDNTHSKKFDWDEEIEVSVSYKDLAIIRAALGGFSTSDMQLKLTERFKGVDITDEPLGADYTLFEVAGELLKEANAPYARRK